MSHSFKLHELLAVEGDREAAYKTAVDLATAVFSIQPHAFLGSIRSVALFDESEPQLSDEISVLDRTVSEVLDATQREIADYFNISFMKDSGNQTAVANLVVDGVTIVEDAPVTWLLGMESKLKAIRKFLGSIPVLQAGQDWVIDPLHAKPDVYKIANPEESYRTRKEIQHKVLYDATDSHPAQIESWNDTINTGIIKKTNWSGMWAPARKNELLKRLDLLTAAVKQARQRANSSSVTEDRRTDAVTDYLFGK